MLIEHCPHAPFGWHAGVAPLQSVSVEHPTQACVVALHTGVAPLQFEFVRQPTQVPAAVLQMGFEPVQAVLFVVEH